MKYQQIEYMESQWKWKYLVKKHYEGESITRYLETNMIQESINILLKYKDTPEYTQEWIRNHMNFDLKKKIQQTIRARRKRYFNAEHIHQRKKSIDLEYTVWYQLSLLSNKFSTTLSGAIVKLIEDSKRKDQYADEISLLKKDLQSFLNSTND
ncbi:macrodomain Ter protein MatP [Candidatus Profftia sp. (ex Adelges kitamiensis)]|uniref:macrodomain Ter protein MatP n=1 Tax=Candidatus Profftia sp. (ex Adelges kitamiensis) TaxID=2864218 RepID=UPI001CE25608|nr:macrodomain Ter protein MatP [Candidatus Profftia sp. (ex Adelges kitamiensis)]